MHDSALMTPEATGRQGPTTEPPLGLLVSGLAIAEGSEPDAARPPGAFRPLAGHAVPAGRSAANANPRRLET